MYRDAIITFFDILGFSEIVKNRSPEEITNILKLVAKVSDFYENDQNELSPDVLVFSDSVIRVRYIDSDFNMQYPFGIVFHELIDLLHCQGELINKGVLIRGGVTIGQITVSDNRVVFGPGFLEAYEIESKYAIYPRIVISPKLLKAIDDNKLLISEIHTPAMEKNHIKELLDQSSEGLWFIDYLRTFESELDEPSYYPEFLFNHRKIICDAKISEYTITERSLKYNWLAHYHNTVINSLEDGWFQDYGIEREQLLIKPEQLATYYVF